jgi:hypothetical protein
VPVEVLEIPNHIAGVDAGAHSELMILPTVGRAVPVGWSRRGPAQPHSLCRAKPSGDPDTAANDLEREGLLVGFDVQEDEAQIFLRALDNDLVYVKPTRRFRARRYGIRPGRCTSSVARIRPTSPHKEYLIDIGGYADRTVRPVSRCACATSDSGLATASPGQRGGVVASRARHPRRGSCGRR